MRILLLALAAVLLLAAPAVAAPVPSYTVLPSQPVQGQSAAFTSTSTPLIVPPATRTVEWDFTASPDFEQTGESVTHIYASCGSRTFRMRVTDTVPPAPPEVTTTTFQIMVIPSPMNMPPVAQFRFSPTAPLVGQEVLFASESTDPDGSVASYEWDFDGDGFDDGNSPVLGHTFGSAGERSVLLRVTDDSCTSTTASVPVTVVSPPANQLPVAQFSVSDLTPNVGEQISLRSFSYDADGSITSQRWDLDGDGDFDETVTGPTAFTSFLTPGAKILRLRVEDSSGGVQTETVNITVNQPPEPVEPSSGPSLMYPFPVIRLAGSVTARGARVRTLEVRAPARSKVTVTCRGKSCPAKKRFAKTSRGSVRFKRMRRFLRAGTVVTVAVRKGNLIGKHTRWLIRAGKPPKRKDSCVFPGRARPARCPSA